MIKIEVMALLNANRNERGVSNWEKFGAGKGGLKSFGIGLTQLRKLAKQIGCDHKLAQRLWETDNHEAKIISLLIDDPKKLAREQAENQVKGVGAGSLAHVVSSCDAKLAKTPFAFDLACEWIECHDSLRRRCGYGLIYELSKNRRSKELTDEFFLNCIDRISESFDQEDTPGRLSMGSALKGIGKRNKRLNLASVKLARKLGPIDFNEGSGNCKPFDVVKHLTSDYLKKKLGV